MHYLDNCSTTTILKESRDKMLYVIDEIFANPSSIHKLGIKAKEIIDESRAIIASALNSDRSNIYFTSGGTESINTSIFGVAKRLCKRGRHIIATMVEHSATMGCLECLEKEGFEITYLRPDKNGNILIEDFINAIRPDTILVTMMMVNNETGNVYAIKDFTRELRQRSSFAMFHLDAVQAVFRLDIDVLGLDVDLLSISGHKIGAPKGVGVLYMKRRGSIPPMIYGGGQENGIRAGTENVSGIAALGAAFSVNMKNREVWQTHVSLLHKYFMDRLYSYSGNIVINGGGIPGIINFSLIGYKGEIILRILESQGVYVSNGSACSGKNNSRVLMAMGASKDVIESALRVCISHNNSIGDVDMFFNAVDIACERLK